VVYLNMIVRTDEFVFDGRLLQMNDMGQCCIAGAARLSMEVCSVDIETVARAVGDSDARSVIEAAPGD